MGLADILTGMMNGPRGQRQPSSGGSGGGMSPIMMALLGLLAYKAFKGRAARQPLRAAGARLADYHQAALRVPAVRAAASTISLVGCWAANRAACGGATAGAKPSGSLSDLFPGGLGSVLGGAAAGSVLSGGLANIIKGATRQRTWPRRAILGRHRPECAGERYAQYTEQADRPEHG
jgi:hypothetical protein